MTDAPRPFRIALPDARLAWIRDGLARAEYPPQPQGDRDWRYGIDVGYLRNFVRYWLDAYDWRRAEAALNRFPQFIAEVEGIDLHFYHVKGSGSRPFPLILTHGWPGSVFEFLHLVETLCFPERFGGNPEEGFDLVIPSLPGMGFSAPPPAPIGPRRIARLWRKLMTEVLGYPCFGAQGGDFGSAIGQWLGTDHADVVLGAHFNLVTLPLSQDPGIGAAEREWQATYRRVIKRHGAYMLQHMAKPQTVAVVLSASPVACAAWILEKFQAWGDTGGNIESRFSKDQMITNLMFYLAGSGAGTAIWLYNGVAQEHARGESDGLKVTCPTAVAEFPKEFIPYPSRDAVARYYNLQRWTVMPSGGHFAALEEPEAFCADVRAFFLGVRQRTS